MQIEFRTGPREVPDHLGALMKVMETYRMTYEEALAEINRKLQHDFLSGVTDRIVDDHLKRMARGMIG